VGGGGGGGQKRRAAEPCKEEEEVAPPPTFLLLRPAASGFFFSGLLPIKEKTQQHHHRHHLLRSNCVVARLSFCLSPRSAPLPQLLGWREAVKEKSSEQRASATALQRRRCERTNALVQSQRRFQRGSQFPISLPHRLLLFLPPGFSLFLSFLLFATSKHPTYQKPSLPRCLYTTLLGT